MNSVKDSTTIIKYRKKKQFDCFDGKINFIIIYIFYDTCNCNNIRHSIVASITACHAVDRRSIRRDGVTFLQPLRSISLFSLTSSFDSAKNEQNRPGIS